jgi:RHS repeat-associated core domain
VGSTVTKYHLIGDKVTCETNGTDTIYYTYDSTGKLVSMNLNGTEYYYISNGQGDITGLFDNSGSQVVSYTYDTWGKLISITGALANTVGVKNPYRYRGYRYDTETGLYYLQSRYYSPEWGRFIIMDSLGGRLGDLLSHNVFAYCKNNCVNAEDPNGDSPWSWAKEKYLDICIKAYVFVSTIESIGFNKIGEGINKIFNGIMGDEADITENVIDSNAVPEVTDTEISTGNNLVNQTKEQLLKSKESYEKLIDEHKARLQDYINNPDAHDNQGILKNAPTPEIRQRIIDGRIKA